MKLELSSILKALKSSTCKLPPLPPSAQAFLGGGLEQPQLWVVDHFQTLEKLADCFRTLCPEKTLLLLPPNDSSDMELQGERLKALNQLQCGKDTASTFVLLTTFQTLEEKLPTLGKPLALKPGDSINPDELFQTLETQGYALDVEVYEKGTAARRGGIVDLWPPTAEHPVRIEFFGDEIDSLRTFDMLTQRSVEKIKTLEIFPLNAEGETTLDKLLPENTLHVYSNVDAMPPSQSIQIGCVTTDTVDIDLAAYETNLKPVSDKHPADAAEQQRKLFFQTLEEMISKDWNIEIYMETEGSRDRIKEVYGTSGNLHTGLLHGSFVCKQAKHLVLTEADIYGYAAKTAHARKKGKATSAQQGERVAEWNDIQPGELVVHADHGIGRYMGVMEIEMAGRKQEMLLIEYAEGARIYLPTGQTHLLTRYTGMGNAAPALHSLKGKRWQNDRASAEAAIEDLAARLLETQATRALQKGRPCGPDTHLQSEFENSFPYMETPDQLAAIQAVKGDLESALPADRLICGDAGYGKTEVAMRAAFKMVMEGRQVAVLVPTTILAQQHFDTFTERMAAFPVSIGMLSRFRTKAEQNETIHRLREGSVNIVIGTHRLVSKDVRFSNLGLVVIDEEQRFGVRAKEHLKQLRKEVDVLTLSATPIPRTLYMGLTGARDMSTISTPPQERQPVETFVLEEHDEIITEAIRHELARDGQVFYLHNRVQTIDKMAERVQELVPEARIEYAHGQMSEKQLSDIMHRFVRGLFDVLICTTIVENGVDIPNCNTILVDRADRFGLADLYQLRGRVGRARRKAFAFLLIPAHGVLTSDARQRIEALKKYTGHGTGFRIAMRDLEIRGAGNLLGAQQSGHIAAIGFDLYCQLLKRSIARLQGKKVPPIIEASVDLDFIERSPASGEQTAAAFIPYSYVDDENLRVKLYGRISSLAKESEVRELKREFSDRFGRLPPAMQNLFEIARMRIAAAQAGIKTIRVNDDRIMLIRNGEPIMVNGHYPRLNPNSTSARLKEVLALLKSFTS
ncbi:transcription-repair coupling factor [Tichowtungia aerotolerans]|uniref:Transcription-repair-coupling factor n=1 Tax=Tichowtungia aerotolerans TaxID=2697043 RepID=A0A6P1M571_9BACT|nr:transcription-repair coupling factor [Tichowtungia aerotolerans]QHI69730.1 transcription-repair coupling factor [Tichowtungia aerotolerans]